MRRAFAASLVLLVGVGCAVGPDYVEPDMAMPDAWHQDLTRGLAGGQGDLQTWWTALDDEILNSLIERAQTGNLDIQLAVARIDEAMALRGLARGSWFPFIDTGATYSRQRLSEGTVPTVPPSSNRTDNFYAAGFDASWEIDLWGRIRRSVESADASLQGSIEDYRDVLVVLYAAIGLTYVDLRTSQERLRLAAANASNQRSTLQLVQDRNRAGLVGDLDVRQAEQNLAFTESFIPTFRQEIAASIHRLGVLIGEYPSSLYGELGEIKPIPDPPGDVVVGLPTELLRQRPDVRAAERFLAAQNAQIGVATAELYPRFSLMGTFALEATDFVDWFQGGSLSYGFGPAVRWNIFDGGRIRANIHAQGAITEQALFSYEQSVLEALEDVETSMVAYVEEQNRRDALQRSANASAAAVALVKTLYRTGLTDFQNVLDTERTLFDQQDSLALSEGLVTGNLIRVYRSLGGGWAP